VNSATGGTAAWAWLLPKRQLKKLRRSLLLFDGPNALATNAISINDSGVVVSDYTPPDNGEFGQGLIRDPNGNLTVFEAPNALVTQPGSINGPGQVTGPF
jgi:hypothetical protein